ncbi:MAG: hypothetical protein LBK99_07495 [Opitutaceae bacterium]|nr:hypothetical protein [Opitutaceae bacterium]
MKIRLQKPESNTMRARLAALAASIALAFSPAVRAATGHTSTVIADGSDSNAAVVLDSGDTINVATGRGIDVKNGGSVTIDPEGGAISMTVTSTDTAVSSVGSGSAVNMGTNSSVNAASAGLRAESEANITANNITITIGSESTPSSAAYAGVSAYGGAQIHLGSGSEINVHGATGVAIRAIDVGNDAVVTVTDGMVIKVTNSGNVGRGAVSDSGGAIHLGTGANIEAERALEGSNRGTITATGGLFQGVGANGQGIHVTGATIDLANSTVWGEKYAIYINSTSSGAYTTGNVILSGGTVSSGSDTVIKGAEYGATNPTDVTVTFTNGAKATSATGGSGFLYEADAGVNAAAAVSVVIDGEGTAVAGRFLDGNSTGSLTVSDGATWVSTGSSVADNLVFNNANVLLTLDSLTDTITANNTLTLTGTSNVTAGLTNHALQEIISEKGGTFELDANALITGNTLGDGSLEYSMLDHNDAGSTWTVADLGSGHFRIGNIVISAVPEPAVCATLAGLAALLARAALRRRRRG